MSKVQNPWHKNSYLFFKAKDLNYSTFNSPAIARVHRTTIATLDD
jgi:hypothetical protein